MGEYADMEIDRLIWGFNYDKPRGKDSKRVWRRKHIPAGPVVRALRMQAHQSFDRLWKKGSMSRGEAYYWLARQLDCPEHKAHMGVMTNKDVLNKVIEVCDKEYGSSVAQNDFPDDLD